jgi:hypothetical protein
MTPSKRIAAAVAVAAGALALALPGSAFATPKPGSLTFQQTFPLASGVCAKVAAGTENKHLAKFAVQVTADCAALEATFTQNHALVLAARTAILPTLTADRAAVHAACPNPKARPILLACKQAHKTNDAAIRSLVAQLHLAYHTYFKSIEAARGAFWSAIHALPGEKHVHADIPITVPPR